MNQSQKLRPPSPTPVKKPPVANTTLGRSAKILVINIAEFLDELLYIFMGELGRTVYVSIQDAIVLIILLKIPSLICEKILHQNYSNFQFCLAESAWGLSRYVCFIIVTANFLLWIVLTGRIIARFWTYLKKSPKKHRNINI
ncbi:hypothetical protein H6G54_05705 [Anabaena cylindrica FACHB-243]|uniref:Uncharacterized protein n=1 Tax=Anabaena cylindrica (strain ATCC 27899 / PCC 7122) TaxID=272123 RepID=K9ZKQ0_ANACC|nr:MULTISPECIES: hypothetical protein [Anabaena]AFZ59813.1 hypothetical protein Anacy_4455 [Anabaena cylindrica PCC 7122]MBD2417214.1 hypothetical protein [Anabaena cylindrica FACHB-243]MCM2404970.1 hypothetical protein [Anabaena sp. CCAP 1446/1C]BAY03134.1 hypothetical protein NIES19_23850 [Anabaena cylindrica PCC 7122]